MNTLEEQKPLTMNDINPFEDFEDNKLIIVDQQEQNNVLTDSWVFIENNEPVTTSLKIAEVFEKNHRDVLRAIDNNIKVLIEAQMASDQAERKIASSEFGFYKNTFKDSSGKSNPMYYLNKDAFSFVVMGFTGAKAAKWKWAYIQKFNKMEKQLSELKKKQPLPKTSEEMFKMAADILFDHKQQLDDHSRRLSFLEKEISDPRSLLRSTVAVTIAQDKRLDKHEDRIKLLDQEISGLAKRDLSDDIKMLISQVIKNRDISYQEAYRLFYEAVSRRANRPAYYIASLVTRQRNRLLEQGKSKTYVQQKVTGISIINADNILREAAESIIISMSSALLES